MAMTLRLNAEQDRALTMLAQIQGGSKQEAAKRAIVATANRLLVDAQVQTLAQQTLDERPDLGQRIHALVKGK